MRFLPLVLLSAILLAPAAAADLYEILGLSDLGEEATDKDIKRQFRALSKQFHPDLNPSDEARQKFAEINRANEILSDKKKRKMYDMRGEEGLKQLEKANEQQGRHDPFGGMFGGLFGGGQQQQVKGQNSQLSVDIPLEDIYNGKVHKLTISKQKVCKKCKGSGAAPGSKFKVCTHCQGQGHIIQRIQLAPGFVQQAQQTCPHCGGKGKEVKTKCPECRGNKVVKGDSILTLDVERGMKDGHQVVFEMEADQSPDLIPGDVILVIKTKNNDVFQRKGDDDLATTVKLTMREALLGFTKDITHMDGRTIDVSRTGVTQFDTVVRIQGEGMPKHNTPSFKGDLYVTYQFELPTRLTAEMKEVLDEIL
ncbi:DNA-J protein, putative [Bodo saltans]|uniref:DNA-J protein, putative n=1 Tax=Bodo saltans TaxID=75058 RepID=A0A0S4JDP6_BODSA|nr:DNA-J protein, putative [Bodo saltans]|eukprot:CUG88240.1 DNA-J protein, putative [Bodo saltans]